MPNAATAAAPATVRAAKVVQRACACGAKGHGECESCKKKRLQRKAAPGGQGAGGRGQGGAGSGNVPTGGGSPLAAFTRQSLEPLFGVNFDGVRIHADAQSDRLAREFEARAFTFGQDIHFAHGEYRPDDRGGLSLLAHELTHTIQQRGAPTVSSGAVEIDPSDSLFEFEAEAAARRVLDGDAVTIRPGGLSTQSVGRVQRQRASSATTETATRTIDEHTRVSITRTLTPRECERRDRTTSTSRNDIFYWDRDANAVGMRYSLCHGRVRLSSTASISYDELVRAGERTLDTLRTNPAAGSDIGGLLQSAIDTSHVTGSGEVRLTVDGILSASVSGTATVGTTDQRYNVRGELSITPNGVSFRITGGIDVSRTPLDTTATYTLEGSATTRFGRITLSYSQIDTSPVGGTPSTDRSASAGLTIPTPDIGPLSGGGFTIGARGNPDVPGSVGPFAQYEVHFDGPRRTERVECYDCDCPPPRPDYTCSRTVDPHTTPVVDQTPDHQTLRLLYAYDSPAPADPAGYDTQVQGIGGMLQSGYSVTAIRGYASPEASRQYNQRLGQQRADAARAALQSEITRRGASSTLPAASGEGELLGESSTRAGGEARNSELIRELSARLTPLTDDQRLDLLGVEGPRRTDPVQRRQALDDIQAFIDGRDADGRRLGTRARWERIFPFLRRVEVEVDRPELGHDEPHAGGTTPNCQPDDLEWARANMSEIPTRQRLPPESCRP